MTMYPVTGTRCGSTVGGTPLYVALREFKRRYLRHMLDAHGGNRTRTAAALSMQRTPLLLLIRRLGIDDR